MQYSEANFAHDAFELEIAVTGRVSSGDLDGALHMLTAGCAPLWAKTRAVGHIAASEPLDALCLTIGAEVLATMDRTPGAVSVEAEPRRCHLYLVTEVYRAGGHGRVLEDLIAASPDREHAVIWTSGEHVSADEIPRRIRVDPAPAVYALLGSPLEKLRRAFALATSLRPDVIYHLGHPNDAVTVALTQPSLARRLVMVHIGDTSFALGRFVAGATHVALGRHFQAVARSAWAIDMPLLPLTCGTMDHETIDHAKPENDFVTATAGAGHKYNPRGNASYLDVLATRFRARGGRHVHFGDLSPAQLQALEDRLTGLGYWDRFMHIEFVPRLSVALKQQEVDLYLDSYPVGGGRANIEAMAAGLPIVTGLYEPNFDGVSFCYPECMTWTTVRELEELLSSLGPQTLTAHTHLSRDYFINNHSTAVFARRLDALIGRSNAIRS